MRNQQQLYCFLTEVFGDEIWQLSLKYLNFMIGYRPKVKFLFKSQKCHHWKSILKWTHKFQYNQRYTSWYKMTYLWFSSHEPNVTMILFPLFNHQWSSLKVKKAYSIIDALIPSQYKAQRVKTYCTFLVYNWKRRVHSPEIINNVQNKV